MGLAICSTEQSHFVCNTIACLYEQGGEAGFFLHLLIPYMQMVSSEEWVACSHQSVCSTL